MKAICRILSRSRRKSKIPVFSRRISTRRSPLIFDSAGTTAQTFAAAYTTMAGTSPSWVAAGAYDAARVLIDALGRADILNRPDSKAADRETVRAALAAIDSPKIGRRRPDGPAVLSMRSRHSAPSSPRLFPLRAVRHRSSSARPG